MYEIERKMTEDNSDRGDYGAEYDETGVRKMKTADALERLAARLRDADSIADDVPVLSELYHKVRTSGRSSRDGRFVALLDYEHDTREWSCRSVAFLEGGTHYRDPAGDVVVAFSPFPFLPVGQFAEHVASDLERDARAARQNAWNYRKAPERSGDSA